MVCLGNICRSPLAEGILKSKVDENAVVVDSAATANYHIGKIPDSRAIEEAAKNNIDISTYTVRQFTAADFENFDVIYAMDRSNYRNILALASTKAECAKVRMILNESFPNSNKEVPDPYYGGDKGFKEVYGLLDDACEQIANSLH